MFANFDYQYFPYVIVTFQQKIDDQEDFESFLRAWLRLYQLKQDFYFIFDTSKMGFINPKYCLMMSLFIRDLKEREYQYLQKSYIITNSKLINRLLDIIFYLQSPVAPVYITENCLSEVIKIVSNEEYTLKFLHVINPR